jgi:hypothetical protein
VATLTANPMPFILRFTSMAIDLTAGRLPSFPGRFDCGAFTHSEWRILFSLHVETWPSPLETCNVPFSLTNRWVMQSLFAVGQRIDFCLVR